MKSKMVIFKITKVQEEKSLNYSREQ